MAADLALLGRVDDGVERFREGLAIAEELGGVEGIALGATNLAILLDRVGRTAEALEVAAAGWERARDIGVERTYGGLLLAVAAKAAIALGRWDEAETFLALGLARDPVGTPGIRLRIQRGRLDTMRGDLVRAAEVLAAASAADEAGGGTEDRAAILAALAELAAVAGETSRAREAVEEGLRMATDGLPDPALAQLAAAGLRVEADAADRSRAARDEAGLADARRRAAAISAQVERIAAVLGVPGRRREPSIGRRAVTGRRVQRPLPCGGGPARGDRRRLPVDRPSRTHSRRSGGRIRPPTPGTAPAPRSSATAVRATTPRPLFPPRSRRRQRLGARPLADEIETLARHARLDLAGTDGGPDGRSGHGPPPPGSA